MLVSLRQVSVAAMTADETNTASGVVVIDTAEATINGLGASFALCLLEIHRLVPF